MTPANALAMGSRWASGQDDPLGVRPDFPILDAGLLAQGYRLFTPAGNRSSILCFYTTKPASDVQAAFNDAKVDATVRADHVRISFALFNNTADVDHVLAITKTLA